MLIEFKAICKKLPTQMCNRLNQIYDCKYENGHFKWLDDRNSYDFWDVNGINKFHNHFTILPSYLHLFSSDLLPKQEEIQYEIC